MMPPALMQSVVAQLCRHNAAQGAVLLLLHQEDRVELLSAGDPSFCLSLPQMLRKMADDVDNNRGDEGKSTPRGIQLPGDVFQINEQSKWRGVLVQATEIQPWGIVANATVPVNPALPPLLVPLRLRWEEVNFIGRAKTNKEEVACGN